MPGDEGVRRSLTASSIMQSTPLPISQCVAGRLLDMAMTRDAEQFRTGAWLRRPGRTNFFALYALAGALLFLGIPFIARASSSRSAGPSVGTFIPLLASCWCIGVPALLFARRLSRAGLWIAADGVVIRNPLRTIVVPLSDAEEFIAGIAGGGNGRPCPILKRRHDRAVGVWALGHEGVIWRFNRYVTEMQPVCDELNAVLRGLRGNPS